MRRLGVAVGRAARALVVVPMLAAALAPSTAAFAGGTPTSSPTGRSGSTAAAPGLQPTATTVTLPTGDRVLLGGTARRPEVRLERSRPHGSTVPASSAAATVLRVNGHTYVVPAAADGVVGSGLSLSVFDVTVLATRQAQRPQRLLRPLKRRW